MSEEKDTTKQPSHHAFHVKNIEGENIEDDKAYFNRIGTAFSHKDGKGLDVLLDSMPIDGRVTLRTPKERLEDTPRRKPRSQGRGRS